VREDVRVKEEWLNPGGRQFRFCREANIESRCTDQRRVRRMLIAAGGDQRNRANMVDAIRVIVNASMQSRRNADQKCPGKRRKQKRRNKNTDASLRTA